MALHKALPTQFGIAAAYWRITSLAHDRASETVSLVLAGSIDEAARRAGAHPLDTTTLTLGPASEPRLALDYADLYDTIKALAADAPPDSPFYRFAGATDN